MYDWFQLSFAPSKVRFSFTDEMPKISIDHEANNHKRFVTINVYIYQFKICIKREDFYHKPSENCINFGNSSRNLSDFFHLP